MTIDVPEGSFAGSVAQAPDLSTPSSADEAADFARAAYYADAAAAAVASRDIHALAKMIGGYATAVDWIRTRQRRRREYNIHSDDDLREAA